MISFFVVFNDFFFLLQSVTQKSEKIGEEEAKCKHMADLAQHDLDEALPAMEEAMRVGTMANITVMFLCMWVPVNQNITLCVSKWVMRV